MDVFEADKVSTCNHLDIFDLVYALKFCTDFAPSFR
jgi:hypothetical protein